MGKPDMAGYSIRFRNHAFPFTPALGLYIVAWGGSLLTLYVIGPLQGIAFRNWAEYYRALGELSRVWGAIFAAAFLLVLGMLSLRSLVIGSLRSLVLRLSTIEIILGILFLANIGWGVVGVLQGNPMSYVIGDTLRGAFIPAIYWIVMKSVSTAHDALSLAKAIIWGETVLLFILVPTDYIPFSFAGRTFLTTVFFTLLIEERNVAKRLLFGALVVFGVFALLTTAAVRGIIIIFVLVILLNYFFRLREIRFVVVLLAFLLPLTALFAVNELFDLELNKALGFAGKRFSGSVGVSGRSRYFGLDESLFQRVGETIDVGRTFMEHSPVYLVTGFGNGAMLVNKLITPSERWVHKTNTKHSLYITVVALLFRNGLLGVAVFVFVTIYLLRLLPRMRKYRSLLVGRPETVYLKVLVLYQFSVILMSFIAYWYVGNVIVAFTLPLVEVLRRDMESRIESEGVAPK